MGKKKHITKILELFDKSPVVDFKSIKRIIKKENYARVLISNLIKSKRIYKLGKGIYTKHKESSLAVYSFQPAYLGLQCALSFHKILEQETNPVILTTRKVRKGIRKVLGSNVLIKGINRKYFFGFEFFNEEKFILPYSDLEKTFIDVIIYHKKIDKDILKKINKKINRKKMNDYLKEYPKRFRKNIGKLIKNK